VWVFERVFVWVLSFHHIYTMTVAEKDNQALWNRVKNKWLKGAKGGVPGKWNARKAMLAVNEYKALGGGYVGDKDPDNSLTKWQDEEWDYADAEEQGRYLPKVVRDQLTPEERERENSLKRGNKGTNIPYSKSVNDKMSKAGIYTTKGKASKSKGKASKGKDRKGKASKGKGKASKSKTSKSKSKASKSKSKASKSKSNASKSKSKASKSKSKATKPKVKACKSKTTKPKVKACKSKATMSKSKATKSKSKATKSKSKAPNPRSKPPSARAKPLRARAKPPRARAKPPRAKPQRKKNTKQ